MIHYKGPHWSGPHFRMPHWRGTVTAVRRGAWNPNWRREQEEARKRSEQKQKPKLDENLITPVVLRASARVIIGATARARALISYSASGNASIELSAQAIAGGEIARSARWISVQVVASSVQTLEWSAQAQTVFFRPDESGSETESMGLLGLSDFEDCGPVPARGCGPMAPATFYSPPAWEVDPDAAALVGLFDREGTLV